MRRSGAKQSEIAERFGVSTPRIGQILSNYKKPTKNPNKKALFVIEEVTKKQGVDLVSAIINCDMDPSVKLELLKNFF